MALARPYSPQDRAACLRVLETNTPGFFVAADQAQFTAFLDRLPGMYLVLVDDDVVVGCGGIALARDRQDQAVLCWGMIVRTHHLRGLGRELLDARLDEFLPEHPDVRAITCVTSQHTQGFYERLGFRLTSRTENALGDGLHACEMILDVVEEDAEVASVDPVIDPASGVLELPGLSLRSDLSRAELDASPLSAAAVVSSRDVRLAPVRLGDESFVVTLAFIGERLDGYSLMMSDPRFGTSWEEWSADGERKRRAAHDAWLAASFGPPHARDEEHYLVSYRFAWGVVRSEYDPRGGFSAIAVRFRGPASKPPPA